MENAQRTAGQMADDVRDKIIVDLRSAAFYAAQHWPGSINIPMEELSSPANLPDGRPLYLICYTGRTASDYAGELNAAGREAYAVKDGWRGCLLCLARQDRDE